MLDADGWPQAEMERIEEIASGKGPAPRQGRVVLHQGSLDQIDADRELEAWLEGLGARLGPDGWVDRFGFRNPSPGRETAMPEGQIVTVWAAGGMAGQATVVRTPMNRSVVTIVEFDVERFLPDLGDPAEPGPEGDTPEFSAWRQKVFGAAGAAGYFVCGDVADFSAGNPEMRRMFEAGQSPEEAAEDYCFGLWTDQHAAAQSGMPDSPDWQHAQFSRGICPWQAGEGGAAHGRPRAL